MASVWDETARNVKGALGKMSQTGGDQDWPDDVGDKIRDMQSQMGSQHNLAAGCPNCGTGRMTLMGRVGNQTQYHCQGCGSTVSAPAESMGPGYHSLDNF